MIVLSVFNLFFDFSSGMKAFIITFGLIGIEEQSHDLLHCLMHSIITVTMTTAYCGQHTSLPSLLRKQIKWCSSFFFSLVSSSLPISSLSDSSSSFEKNSDVYAGHRFQCSGSHMVMVFSGSRQGSRKGPIAKPILTESLSTFLNHRFGRNIIVFF